MNRSPTPFLIGLAIAISIHSVAVGTEEIQAPIPEEPIRAIEALTEAAAPMPALLTAPPLDSILEVADPISPTPTGLLKPVAGIVTSSYGQRWGRPHRGVDFGAPIGTPIVAAADGVVEFSGWSNGGYGNKIDIRHPNGALTRYAHSSRLLVRVGDCVTKGQLIALVGSTGRSTGPHLHFELHLPGQGTVDPLPYLS